MTMLITLMQAVGKHL